ncbi:MAG: hypothetical protein P8129_08255 [Anaerolineae bacterium]
MYRQLASLFPPLAYVERVPLSRDQLMLLLTAANGLLLGLDHYLAHMVSGTVVGREWIPIVFEPIAGALLLLLGIVALRRRSLATIAGSLILLASIAVGLLGAYFHFLRAVLPGAPAGQRISLALLVWAPPVLGPLFLALVGMVGISAVWQEEPPDSGRLLLVAGRTVHMPYSKTRAYFFLVALGALAATISSVLDHSRTGFENPWLWLPTAVGVLATAVALGMGALRRRGLADVLTYAGAMTLMLLVGVVGFVLHVQHDLVAGSTIVVERFIRGAPLMAPLLFSNMGLLGLIVLYDRAERPE